MDYQQQFTAFIQKGIDNEILDPVLNCLHSWRHTVATSLRLMLSKLLINLMCSNFGMSDDVRTAAEWQQPIDAVTASDGPTNRREKV